MAQFNVQWTIDIEADGAEDAARKALAIQRDPTSIATVFGVLGSDGDERRSIDLTELDDPHEICPDNFAGHDWKEPRDERRPTECRHCGATK